MGFLNVVDMCLCVVMQLVTGHPDAGKFVQEVLLLSSALGFRCHLPEALWHCLSCMWLTNVFNCYAQILKPAEKKQKFAVTGAGNRPGTPPRAGAKAGAAPAAPTTVPAKA